MTDSVAPTPDMGTDIATDGASTPAITLRGVLADRVIRIEEEFSLIEGQYRTLQTRINQYQARRDAAEWVRLVMLSGLDRYGPDEVRDTFDEFSAASRELALAEQRFDALTDRVGDAKDRLKEVRGDLELLADTVRNAGGSAAEAESNAYRSTSRQVIQIIEEQRMRIARDMHDGPAQSMSNLVLQAEILERLVNKPEAILAELQDFKNSVRNALDETRQLIFDLRPMTLDDLRLVRTFRRYS